MPDNSCFIPPIPGNLWQFSFDEALVLARPDLMGLFILNSSGAVLWNALLEGRSLDDIAHEFSLLYGISLETGLRDITAAVEQWSTTILSPVPVIPAAQVGTEPAPSVQPVFVGRYVLNGKGFQVAIEGEDLVQEIAPRLQPLIQETVAHPDVTIQVFRTGSLIEVLANGECLASEDTPSAARSVLLQEMVRLSEDEQEWLAVVHAGACGTESECVLLAAPSHSGKTTLMAALMHHGLVFYSDDSVPIEKTTLKVAAMPFALMIREGSWGVLQSRFPELQEAAVFSRTDAEVRFLQPKGRFERWPRARVKALVFPDFAAGAATNSTALNSWKRC